MSGEQNPLVRRLYEARRKAWESMKETHERALSENREMSADEQKVWDDGNADVERLDERIREILDAEERQAEIEASMAEIEGRETRVPQGGGQATIESDLRKFLLGEAGRSFDLKVPTPEEQRALSVGTSTAGGDTVPTDFYNRIVEHEIEVSGVLSLSPTVMTTAGGETIEVPITTNHGAAAQVAEGGTLAGTDPAFSKRSLGAYKYGQLVILSRELVADTGVNLLDYLARTCGRAVGLDFGEDLVVGNGSSKPSGIFQTSTLGVTGGTTVGGAFTADNLIDLFYSVIAPYRNSRSAGWLMKDSSVAAARKLKDANDQYLWQPGLQIGAPDLLLGKPVRTDPFVAAIGLSAKSVAFGDFGAYWVRYAGGYRFERSDDFAFDTDQVAFRAIRRGDGLLVDQTGAVKHFVGGAS